MSEPFRLIKQFLRKFITGAQTQTLSSLNAYAKWAATYPPHAHNALMQAEERAMLDLLPDLTGRLVLDLACGTGRYGLIAHERGARQVVGVDNSAAMLAANPLQQRALATTEAIPLKSASVDVILCGLALGHLPRLAPSLGEISRVLTPRGCALVSDFHPFLYLNGARRTFQTTGQTFAVEHYAHLYSDYHRAATASGLQIERIAEPQIDPAQGGQTGVPVVIVYCFAKV